MIDGVRYLDGAIVDDVPVSRAVELGARTIYVLQVSGFARPRPEPRRPLDVAIQSYWIARHHRFKRELERRAAPTSTCTSCRRARRPSMRFDDFTRSAELMSLAYEASSDYLAGRPAQPALPEGPVDPSGVASAPAGGGDGLAAMWALDGEGATEAPTRMDGDD